MNKLFAALMTAMILGTVAVVFALGIMSLGGLPENTTPKAEQIKPDSGLTYGTDFTDWQYLTSVAQTHGAMTKQMMGGNRFVCGAFCRHPCRTML